MKAQRVVIMPSVENKSTSSNDGRHHATNESRVSGHYHRPIDTRKKLVHRRSSKTKYRRLVCRARGHEKVFANEGEDLL